MSTAKLCCLVSQPNSVVLEVEVELRANGQECLEKVWKHFLFCRSLLSFPFNLSMKHLFILFFIYFFFHLYTVCCRISTIWIVENKDLHEWQQVAMFLGYKVQLCAIFLNLAFPLFQSNLIFAYFALML